jgi:hypothetical protein
MSIYDDDDPVFKDNDDDILKRNEGSNTSRKRGYTVNSNGMPGYLVDALERFRGASFSTPLH